jgi:putative transposase
MTANHSIDPAQFLSEHLERAEPDLLRSMLKTFIEALMGADADALCGARTVRAPRIGQLPQRIPGPGVGYPRRHHGGSHPQAALGVLLPRLAAGAAPAGRAGVDHGGGDLLSAWGEHAPDGEVGRDVGYHPPVTVPGLQHGQELDEQVADFRSRPLDAGPYTFVAADALVLKVREGGRVVNVHALVATGVNADGNRVRRCPSASRT